MRAVHVVAMLAHIGLCITVETRDMSLQSCSRDAEDERVQDIVERVLQRRRLKERVDAENVCMVLRNMERKGILESDERGVFLRILAEVALYDGNFKVKIAERRDESGVRDFVLQMLRECMDMQDVDVRVEDGTATLCPRTWQPRTRYGSADAVEAVSCVRVQAEAMKRIELDNTCPVVWFIDVMEIRRLDVSGCELDNEVLRNIGELRSVRSLGMQGCKMAKGGLGSLSREMVRDLEELDVSENVLGRCDVVRIGKMRSMVRLSVSRCDVEMGGLLTMVEEMKSLRELRALGNRVSEEDLKMVGERQELRVLEIGVCYAKEGSLSALEKLKELEELSVSCIRVSKKDMDGMSRMKCLKRLEMRSREMEQGSFEDIYVLEQLEQLSVACGELGSGDLCGIGRAGLTSLKMCGVVRRSLRHMRGRRDDSQESMEMESVGESRRDLESLQVLDVSKNKLDRSDVYEIGKMVGLKSLNIRYCKVCAGSVKSLRRLASLEELRMYGNNINREDLRELAEMRGLRVLDIGDCNIRPGGMKYLRGMEVQRQSMLAESVLGTLRRLWRSKESLESGESSVSTGGTLRRQRSSEERQEGECNAEDRRNECLELEVLCVTENELSENDLMEIGEITSLTKLYMDYCKAKPGSMRHLKKLARLRELSAAEWYAHKNEENKSIMEELRQKGVDVRGD